VSLIPVISDEQASPEARVLFEHSVAMFGRVANAMRVAAHSPKLAQAIFGFMVPALREEITEVLDVRTKALVILKTSMLNGCNYCIGHNLTLGRACGMTEEEVAAIEGDMADTELFSAAEKAAITWAQHLTLRTYRQHPEAMQELKRHFNEAQIVEITMVSGFFNFWNRFVDSLQVDVEQRDVGKLFAKSVSVDPASYLAYMQDCWWREDETAGPA
jgi:AhpD family alkylhydroperoxidase